MSSYHAWTHARKEDGGTDPVPYPEPEWVAANGSLDVASGDGAPAYNALWTGVWLDPNPKNLDENGVHKTFDIVENPNGSSDGAAADAFGIRLKRSGLYTVHLHASTNDLTAGDAHDIFITIQLVTTSTVMMPNALDLAGANNSIYLEAQDFIETGNPGAWIGQKSVTTPIWLGATSIVNAMKLGITYTNHDAATIDWYFKLWVARHGPIVWPDANMGTPTFGTAEPGQ